MNERISGRCACGAIKYSTTAKSQFTLICQCRQCQRISGSGHAAQFAVPVNDTTIEGEVSFYDQIADSGNTVSSGFCATCGSPMMKKTTKAPELYFFHAATMDDPSAFKPQVVVYEDSKQPWDYVDPDIPRK
ncbi:MAG: GFA family protein [Gammaproteobacteria bacterium]|nr:GFA family protein [Gammaproteobacteria bacterium]